MLRARINNLFFFSYLTNSCPCCLSIFIILSIPLMYHSDKPQISGAATPSRAHWFGNDTAKRINCGVTINMCRDNIVHFRTEKETGNPSSGISLATSKLNRKEKIHAALKYYLLQVFHETFLFYFYLFIII